MPTPSPCGGTRQSWSSMIGGTSQRRPRRSCKVFATESSWWTVQGGARIAGRGERVDLLFTDLVMPGGIDDMMLAHVASARYPGLKVI